MNRKTLTRVIPVAFLLAISLPGCHKDSATPAAPASAAPAKITNRVDISDAVRKNLGMTFAKTEIRRVAGTVRYPGVWEAAPESRRPILAPVAGRLTLLVHALDQVKVGQIIARIDAPLLRDIALQQSEAASTRERAKAQLNGITAQTAAINDLRTAILAVREQWVQRLIQLDAARASGAAVNSAWTEASANRIAADERLAEAQQQLAVLNASAAQAEVDLKAAERRIDILNAQLASMGSDGDQMVLRSPSDGVVESVSTPCDAWLEPNTLIMTVLNPAAVRCRAIAPHGDIGRLKSGLPAAIAAQGKSITSMTADLRLAPTADTAGLVLFATPTAPANIAPGTPAFLEVVLDGQAAPQLALPAGCIVTDGGKPWIFRRNPKNPNEAIRQEADIGRKDGRFVEILSGLAAGDEVVMDGAFQLMLATSSSMPKGGHFHADGTFHEGGHEGEGK